MLWTQSTTSLRRAWWAESGTRCQWGNGEFVGLTYSLSRLGGFGHGGRPAISFLTAMSVLEAEVRRVSVVGEVVVKVFFSVHAYTGGQKRIDHVHFIPFF